jgi:hypothetical protein
MIPDFIKAWQKREGDSTRNTTYFGLRSLARCRIMISPLNMVQSWSFNHKLSLTLNKNHHFHIIVHIYNILMRLDMLWIVNSPATRQEQHRHAKPARSMLQLKLHSNYR